LEILQFNISFQFYNIMAFNPLLPIDGSLVEAAELRAQYTGLADQIAAIPAGPPGPMGPQGDPGPPFAAASVDTTITLPPGGSAGVTAIFDGVNVRFSFQIPQGAAGEVTLGDMSNAINNVLSNSSGSSNGVALLLPANPSPSAMDVAQKLDELIQALRR
jgi:hypothetical protein